MIHELVRRVITRFVEDAFGESRARLAALGPASVDDIRRADRAVAAFSDEFAAAQKEIKDFLFSRMYRHRAILPVWKNAGTNRARPVRNFHAKSRRRCRPNGRRRRKSSTSRRRRG